MTVVVKKDGRETNFHIEKIKSNLESAERVFGVSFKTGKDKIVHEIEKEVSRHEKLQSHEVFSIVEDKLKDEPLVLLAFKEFKRREQDQIDRATDLEYQLKRPQKGRLREFHQFGCEVFGISNVYEDANIIMLIREILEYFGIGFTLKLNSLGCVECMPQYKNNLVNHLNSFKSELCEDCNRRVDTNPIRVLDCKNEKCQTLLKDAPKITNSLCSSCDSDFEKLKEILDFNKVDYEIDSNLVRGLDYYNKTAFEFVSNEIGAQSAIAGGGRYDRLVEYLGGKSTAGIGFAIGIERLLELVKMNKEQKEFLYIGVLDEISLNKAFEIAIKKRKTTKTYIEYTPRGFAKHFGIAQKLGCNIVALIGEKELENGIIYTKNLNTKEENNIILEDF